MKNGLLSSIAGLCLSAAAFGQVVSAQDFEGTTYGGWLVNGNEMIFPDGNPGQFMGLPFQDFEGVTLRNETPSTDGGPCGDLTVYPSLTVSVDFRITRLENFFGEPMDPAWFTLTLELVDYGNEFASVYFVGPPLPATNAGWVRYTWTIPDTSQTALPPGWRGNGAEDPVTYEPILPPGRTWHNVLQNVDEIHVTTMTPGYFYSANFWEAGFDNVLITVGTGAGCGSADFDCDGDVGTDADIEAFFACIAGTCPGHCASNADFNGDGDIGTDADIEAFFRVLGGGTC